MMFAVKSYLGKILHSLDDDFSIEDITFEDLGDKGYVISFIQEEYGDMIDGQRGEWKRKIKLHVELGETKFESYGDIKSIT